VLSAIEQSRDEVKKNKESGRKSLRNAKLSAQLKFQAPRIVIAA